MRSRLLILSLVVLALSCAEKADIPIYVTLEEPIVHTIDDEQGTNHQQFTHYYVFNNTEIVGVYEPGQEFPIIINEDNKINVFPGILVNGRFSAPDIYAPMTSDSFRILADEGEHVSFQPVLEYNNKQIFRLLENFEAGTRFTDDIDGNPETALVIQDGVGFGGSKAGVLKTTDANRDNGIAYQFGLENLPISRYVYLELTYKNDVSLFVGVIGFDGGQETLLEHSLYVPKDDWNKVYIDLSSVMSNTYRSYRVFFSTSYNPNLIAEEAYVYLDDIKLIHN